jgi:hypothetical protein
VHVVHGIRPEGPAGPAIASRTQRQAVIILIRHPQSEHMGCRVMDVEECFSVCREAAQCF